MIEHQPAAKTSSELYDLFMQAPTPICVLRGDQLVYEMANPIYERVANRGRLAGRAFLDVFPEVDGQGVDTILRDVMRTGVASTQHEALVRFDRDGDGVLEDASWTCTYTPLRIAAGPSDRVMVFCAEVTDQVLARQETERAWREAREARERLHQALEVSALGTWEFDPVTGEEHWSDRARAIFGIAADEPLTFDRWVARIHPDDRERVLAVVQRTLERPDEEIRVEYRLASDPRGEQWVRSVGRALRDGAGRPVRVIGTVKDVSESKRAQREALMRAVITSNATLPLFLLDATQQCTYMNAAAEHLTGYTFAEVQGRPLHQVIHHSRPDGTPYPLNECPIDRAFPQNAQEQGEDWFVHKDGHFYPVAYTASPIREEGLMLGTVIEVRDISREREIERIRAEAAGAAEHARAQAEAASRAKDEFLAMLGHELRNPLAPILTALQLMQLRGGNALAKERSVIERQVHHLVRLVDDLLDVSRIARGKVDLKRRPVEIAEVIAKAVEMTSPLLEQRSHRVATAVATNGLRVDADESRLAQVFANLLTNAAKYTEPGGSIQVSAAVADGHVVVRVKDSGVGINPDLLPRIFEQFVQGTRGPDRSEGGLGLGLAIVKNLVELHGGHVTAQSDGGGHGSEFRVRLPLAEHVSAAVDRHGLAGARPGRVTDRGILVVDDNQDAASLLAEALREIGYDARTAMDAPSALALAAEWPPQIALLDIGLPVMDGYEVARRIRELPGCECVRFVAVTGYGQDVDRERSKAAGFAHHVVKPVDIGAIVPLLDRLLQSQR